MVNGQFRVATAAASLVLVFSILAMAMPAGSRVTLPNGKKIFVVGMNLAWKNFANDVGDTPLDTSYFNKAFREIADSGANCMRVWLSTNGTKDPKYGSDGLVSGPGTQTVANIQKMLKIAKKNNILLMPVLLTHNWVQKDINATILENNKKMLKTEAGLQAYIDKYLVPVVTAIGNDPGLICWEIFNEPEGMVQGWSSPANTITQAEVQRAVNRIAAAIRTAVPDVLISNGAVATGYLSWYTDAALKTAGGRENGMLDFYMAHYYGWNGTTNSPFTKNYAHWNLDKPLVIGEYASTSWSQSTSSSSAMQDGAKVDTLLTYLYKAGYAGGLGWQYQQDGGDPWMKGFSTFGHSMAQVYRLDSNSIKLTGTATNTFSVSTAAGNGGTVSSSIAGRVDSGKTVTLTATALPGYQFTGWSGDTTSTEATLVIKSVVKDWTLQATFEPQAGTNLIRGGDFSDGTNWGFYAAEGNTATAKYTDARATVTITGADSLNYHIQLTQGGIELDSGSTYLLSFEAWSTGNRPLYIGLSTEGTWHFQGGGEVSITGEQKKYEVEITPDSSTTAGILQFNCGGGSLLPVYVDNVSMVVKPNVAIIRDVPAFTRSVRYRIDGNRLHWFPPSPDATVELTTLQGRTLIVSTSVTPISLRTVPNGIFLMVFKNGSTRQTSRVHIVR